MKEETKKKNLKKLIEDDKNDVVFTPEYTADLMCKIAKIDENSYVWDPCFGTGNLLNAAVENGAGKIGGVEFDELVYEVGKNIVDSDNLYHGDSYEYEIPEDVNTIIINPPYSAKCKGLGLLEKSLDLKGAAVILVTRAAGRAGGNPMAQEILKKWTLIAEIKMPVDLFKGCALVETSLFVFKMGRPHKTEDLVKFIDFTDDGWNRETKKGKIIHVNNKGDEKAEELLKILEKGEGDLDWFEDNISLDGGDWLREHHEELEFKVTHEDFEKTILDYLIFEKRYKQEFSELREKQIEYYGLRFMEDQDEN